MRLRTIASALFILLASAGFETSFAQTAAVSERSFDWIFFAIVGIPFVIALFVLFSENAHRRLHGSEPTTRSWPPSTSR